MTLTFLPFALYVGISLPFRMMTVRRRGEAKVDPPLSNAPLEIHTAHELARPLPYEIVENITAHLIHDLDALKACSLTSRSWYIAAVPHLHHTLTLGTYRRNGVRGGLESLSKLHELDLMPLVEEIRVYQFYSSRPWFGPQAFGRHDLFYFSAFANIQTLKVQNLEIYRFLPGVERYFEHFSPTLRSIALSAPRCTPRQLSHFLSLFSNLDNTKTQQGHMPSPSTTIPDTDLAPFSAQKLRGRLELENFCWVETWMHLITPYGGLRFHYMDLSQVAGCAPVLLEACAETLETLRFYVTDDSVGKGSNMSPSMDSSG